MKHACIIFILGLFLMTSCQGINPQITITDEPLLDPTPTKLNPTVTATEVSRNSLTICTTTVPDSLFLYDADQTSIEENLLALIGAAPFVSQWQKFDPVLIEKIPSQSDGDLRIETLDVEAGQPIVDASGEVAVLKPGLEIRPGGCRSAACVITWDGQSPLEMDQMVMEFRLVDGLTWSDGVPVRAEDSVFSFEIASDAERPGLQWAESRTQSYDALDEDTTLWRGLPGFTTSSLEQFFWLPLPIHRYPTDVGWSDMVNDLRATTAPLSYGPFMVADGSKNSMVFVPNPHYVLNSQGLPNLDEVEVKVVGGGVEEAITMLGSGACDVLDASFNWLETPMLFDQIQSDDRYSLLVEGGLSWVQLAFGIESAPIVGVGTGDEPALLKDARTRQAIFACLDREEMMATTIGNLASVWPSFLPPEDSRLTTGEGIAYDPSRGAELLASAGWVDHDDDPATPLQAQGVINVPFGTLLSLELFSSNSAFQQDLANAIQEDLSACGIEVTHSVLPVEALYASGPEGPIFGRQFDLALINWQPLTQEDCFLYDSTQIPSAENYWIGTNIAGLSDQTYDEACRTAILAVPDEVEAANLQAERAYLDALPAVPLFSIPSVLVIPANACESGETTTENEFFRQLEAYQFGSDCQ